ncbi:hypothetical protein D3C71_1701980 [compost metagenome]
MQFNSIEAGLDRQACGGSVLLDHGLNIFLGHGAWRRVRLVAEQVGAHLSRAHLGGGAENFGTFRHVGLMCNPPRVHQLHYDLSTLGMYRTCHQLPPFHVGSIEEAGNSGIAQTVGRR